MNQTTYRKIYHAAARLHKIHADCKAYDFVLPLLDEPYRLTLKILDCEDLDIHEAAKKNRNLLANR